MATMMEMSPLDWQHIPVMAEVEVSVRVASVALVDGNELAVDWVLLEERAGGGIAFDDGIVELVLLE